jgi:hypothetical protein
VGTRGTDAALAARLSHVLWLGGISAVGKTTAALALARRHDLRLYSLDERRYDHASRLSPEPRSLDELWVDATPFEIAVAFERSARERFRLVIDDLLSLPDDAPLIAEGHQLLPELVAPFLTQRQAALFVVGTSELQRRVIRGRGDDLHTRTRDPTHALENRLGRDKVLARRVRAGAAREGLTLVHVDDIAETAETVEREFESLLQPWKERADRGDVSARRREANDVRLRYLLAHRAAVGSSASRINLVCECSRAGCLRRVQVDLREAQAARAVSPPLVAEGHR